MVQVLYNSDLPNYQLSLSTFSKHHVDYKVYTNFRNIIENTSGGDHMYKTVNGKIKISVGEKMLKSQLTRDVQKC